jgi:alpha-tubulin suppressor-like RCC1 family protein
MKKCLQGVMTLALILLWIGCPNPLRRAFDNPVDDDSNTYIGTPSEDNDGDGIPQYEDVDEIILLSPGDGQAVTKLPISLVTNKFDPAKVQRYWIRIATFGSDFDGSVIFSKDDYATNECGVPAGVITENMTYYWRAKSSDGSKWSDNWSTIRSFVIDVDTSVPWYPSPTGGSTIVDTTPLLNWEDVAGASGYQVQVNTNDSFTGTMVVDNSALMTSQYQVATPLSDNTNYYWHVKVRNADGVWGGWSSTWSFTIDIVSPANPSPSSGSTITDTTPLLDWEDVAGASGYHVQVNTNDSFTGTMAADDDALTGSQYQVATILSDNTTYYWHVKVRNADGVWSDWSNTWSFMVDIAPPLSPVPTSGTTTSDATPLLNWEDVAGANGYNIQVSTNEDFLSGIVSDDSTLTNSQYQVMTLLLDNTIYYWHVRVRNSDVVWSEWSSTWNITFNVEPPAVPRPTNGVYIPITAPILNWENAVGASGYQLQVNTNSSFTGIMVTDSTTSASQYQVTAPLADHTTYYWHVRMKNDDGVWSEWSGTWSYTVDLDVATAARVGNGRFHSFAVKSDGTLWACGSNSNGQLGTGDTIARSIFTQVLTGVSFSSGGYGLSLALKNDGTLWGCGIGAYCGTGSNTEPHTFTQVLTDISAISVGLEHSIALKNDGTLWVCGQNSFGQLGTGDMSLRLAFTQVFTGVSAVYAGWNHSLVLKSDNTLWACGNNPEGQLGTGDTDLRLIFTQVLADVRAVAAGLNHTLAIKSDNTLWVCGSNYYGQLGFGDTTDRHTFTQVLTGVSAIAAGGGHSLAIKKDGTLWACGDNYWGQLGTENTTNRTTFTQVLTGVSAISVGGAHSMVLKSDGTLWTCGYNNSGWLGTGDTSDRHSFTQVYVY